jgi:hypothetical protein
MCASSLVDPREVVYDAQGAARGLALRVTLAAVRHVDKTVDG